MANAAIRDFPAIVALSEHPAWVEIESGNMSGTPGAYLPDEDNLSCQLDISETNSSDLIVSLTAPYSNVDRRARFNIGFLFDLKPHLPTTSSLTNNGSYQWSECVGMYINYDLNFNDKFGSPPVMQTPTVNDQAMLSMVYGGKARHGTPYMIDNYEVLSSLRSEAGLLIEKPTTKTQPEYLYFWSLQETNAYRIEVDFHYTDGTTDAFVDLGRLPFFVNKSRSLFQVACGWDQLDLSSIQDGAKTVYKYTVYLRQDNDDIIGAVTYKLVEDYHDHELFLIFPNGIGGMETARLRGGQRRKSSVTRQEAASVETKNFTLQQGTMSTRIISTEEEITVSTGFYSKDYIYHLRNLLCDDVWVIDKSNGRFLKYLVKSTEADYYDSETNLYSFDLKLIPAWVDTRLNHGNISH